MTITEIRNHINQKMHPGTKCPSNGCLGECAIIVEIDNGMYQANISWWQTPPKPSAIKPWFVEIGMSPNRFIVQHTIYDEMNYIADEICEMGEKEIWEVVFYLRSEDRRHH